MTLALTIAGLALLAVAFSVGRRAWIGRMSGNPFVAPFLLVTTAGGFASIYMGIVGGG